MKKSWNIEHLSLDLLGMSSKWKFASSLGPGLGTQRLLLAG